MTHSLKVVDGGVLEIVVDTEDVPKIDKVVLKYFGLEGYHKTFIPALKAVTSYQRENQIEPGEPEELWTKLEEPEELEDCITGGTYNSVSVVEPSNCTFNIYPKE